MDFDSFKLEYPQFSEYNDITEVFLYVCREGMLDLAKVLVTNFPNIDVHSRRPGFLPKEHAFRFACKNNHIEMVKWLKSTWPNINHREEEDYAIKSSLYHVKISKWLITLYNIEDIHIVINIYFKYQLTNNIRYIIGFFDLTHLVIGEKYQSEFDDMLLEHNSNFNRKSARK